MPFLSLLCPRKLPLCTCINHRTYRCYLLGLPSRDRYSIFGADVCALAVGDTYFSLSKGPWINIFLWWDDHQLRTGGLNLTNVRPPSPIRPLVLENNEELAIYGITETTTARPPQR